MRGGKRISSTIGEALIDVVRIAGFEWPILYGIRPGRSLKMCWEYISLVVRRRI